MPKQLLSEVVNKALQFFKADPHYDSKPLIQLIMKIRGCESVFQLLQSERAKVVAEELEFRKHYKREPLLTWSVKNISFCFYK